MELNIKEKVEELVEKIKGDPETRDGFKKSPIETVEKLLGVDLPDEQIKALVAGIQAKLGGGIGNIVDKIKDIF